MSSRLGFLAGLLALFAAAVTGLLPTAAQAQDPSFYVTNRSGMTINEVRVSSSNDNNWGQDLLGSNTLAIGQSLTLSNITAGVWDIRVVDGSGHWNEWRNETIEPGTQYTLDVDGTNWNSQR